MVDIIINNQIYFMNLNKLNILLLTIFCELFTCCGINDDCEETMIYSNDEAFNLGPYRNKIIAHRGIWKGNTYDQNSIKALTRSVPGGIWGCEIDVWETIDGRIVLSHDRSIHDIDITSNTFKDINDILAKEGYYLPSLEESLYAISNTDYNLIIEVKNAEIEKLYNIIIGFPELRPRLSYMSFSSKICEDLIAQNFHPTYFLSSYINFDIETLSKKGYDGVAVSIDALRKDIKFLTECHDLNLKILVWTVNDIDDVKKCLLEGVDFVITDIPEKLNYYQ